MAGLILLQDDVGRVVAWTEKHGLRINTIKAVMMLVSKRKQAELEYVYRISGNVRNKTDCVKGLRVIYSKDLSVNTIVKKAYMLIGFLWRCAKVGFSD